MPLRFGPLTDFFANVEADDLEFVKEIRGMSEARKVGERFRSPKLMASTGWFPHFPLGCEDAQRAEEAPSAVSSPSSSGLPGNLAFVLFQFQALFSQSSNLCCFCGFFN